MRCVQKWCNVRATAPLMVLLSVLACPWGCRAAAVAAISDLWSSAEQTLQTESNAQRLGIYIPFILPYLTSAGLCWRSSAEGNDDDTAMSSVRDVFSTLSSAPRSPPVEAIIYWGSGVDPRVWGGQMPDEGSAATELEMEATENRMGRAKLARFPPGGGRRADGPVLAKRSASPGSIFYLATLLRSLRLLSMRRMKKLMGGGQKKKQDGKLAMHVPVFSVLPFITCNCVSQVSNRPCSPVA